MKKFLCSCLPLAAVAALLAPGASAESISDFTTNLTSYTSTQNGRLSRNNVPQDWAGSEAYPGLINTGTRYYYKSFTFAASAFAGAPYVEITSDEPANTAAYFVSVYAGNYDPTNPGLTWLGDEGFSGNYVANAGGDTQVILPAEQALVVVLNTVSAGMGSLSTPIHLSINAYADTEYAEPSAVTPEPASFALLGTGILGMAGLARRRFQAR